MRSVQFPRKSVGGSSKSLARLLKVIDISHGALLTETPVTKRDIYYHDVNLFKSQSVVDSLVDDLAATFSLARADLNIRASSKGLFCGAGLVLHMRGGGRVVGDDTKGTLVPVGEDIFRVELDENIAWILVVEKDAVFQTLCTLGLAMNVSLVGPGIIITGKGYPDLATRQLVKTLSDNLTASIPIMALVDADPYGIDIMSVYRYGSERMRHESDTLAAGRVQWIGVKTSELSGIGIEKESLIPISVHDHKKALSMLRSRPHMPAEWRKELQYMLQTRCKAEIEVISCTRTALEDKSRLEDMNSDRRIHPLVSYLIRKINETIASSS
ncbi:topoisomerase acting in meiosis [Rickenella mellea]|uniref:DNA topoisomerase (ATP-hydrolyzing) n=1 Tax=Rickenella mellea TaxID=50990 RepID=A0A4Y7Q634_9AGAM|nr:topoisomerase acting in meiosis [Rickenella mellea]